MPHAGQQEILNNAARFNTIECGRRFGKSILGQVLACQTALQAKPIGWFAPTYKFLADPWRALVDWLAPVTLHLDKQEKRIELITGGSIDFWSLTKDDAGRGRRYARVIVDEAGLVKNLREVWTYSLRATLTDYSGDAWFLGTPKGRNYFHQLYAMGEAGSPGWRSWRRGTVHNPHISPDEIAEAERMLPPEAFAQEYLGIPADDGANPFGLDAIRRCIVDRPSAAPTFSFGVDLAKSVDWTWVVGLDRDGAQTVSQRWQGPWHETIPRVESIIGNRVSTLVDATGVGDPIVEALQRGRQNVTGFKFTATSKQQLMESLRLAIQCGEVRICDPQLIAELESFEYVYTPTGVRYSAPSGLHDDGVMALALAVWQRKDARAPGDVGVTI